METGRRRGCDTFFFLCAFAAAAEASSIVPPDISASDAPLCGGVVASPNDGPRMLFHNPAGVAGIEGSEAGYGVFGNPVGGRYENEATGYDEKSNEFAAAPTVWLKSDALAPWHVGAGIYGAVGTSYNFAADPAAGFPNRFLGESSVLQLGFVVGRELAPGLRVGLQIAPTYGKIRARFPSPLGPVSFDVDGFGIGGIAGLTWEFVEGTTFGAAYRGPARVFMSGDADVGETDDEVEITFHVPQWVAFGFAHEVSPSLRLLAQARWTDYSEFEKGVFEYDRTPALDQPFIASAKARFRYAAGFEWGITEQFLLRGGMGAEDWMIEESAVSPLLYDNADILVGLGLATRFLERWKVDATLGYAFADDRKVTAEENPLFPGRYQLEVPFVAGFLITYRFGEGDGPSA
jgi:long-subunit fatty acid transport protein